MMSQIKEKKEYRLGIAAAILCAVLWGLLPIYWKALGSIDSFLIILYRIVLVFVFAVVLCLKTVGWQAMKGPFKEKGLARNLFFAGMLISCNWSIYIWAVANNFIIQASIGYYIEPLLVCVFGVVFFHEKLSKYKLTALMIAGLGVLVMLVFYRQIPVIALTLAVTFATYAAIKRKYRLNALLALLYETMFLMPPALAAILFIELSGKGAFATAEPYQIGLLMLAGIFTGTPLMLFAMAANRISLVTLGITEYIAPSLSLVLGIFVYHEPFDLVQFATFAIIWVGLVVFTIGEWKEVGETAAGEIGTEKFK